MLKVTPDEALQLSELAFEWADSVDTKDWDRLRLICAPVLLVDYTSVLGKAWESMSLDDYVGLMSSPSLLGNPLISTQHHIGGAKFRKISESEITGWFQLRAAHQRHAGEDKQVVEAQGHGHGISQFSFKRHGQAWQLAGLRPRTDWFEHDFQKVFADK